MNTSGLGKLNLNDLLRGAVSAVGAAVFFGFIGVLQGVFGAPDFNLFAVQWGVVLMTAVNTAVQAAYTAFVGYISKSLLTDSEGTIHIGVAKIKTK